MRAVLHSRAFLWAEFLLLTVVVPLTLWQTGWFRIAIYPILWGIALVCWLILRRDESFSRAQLWNGAAVNGKNMKEMLALLLPISAALLAFTVWYAPERMFAFPLERPQRWAMVMALYPILSAYPQEIIYRVFLFQRYRKIIGEGAPMILASAVAFGFAHIMMANWIALVFSAAGGLIFGLNYYRHRSLALVTLQHALYGNIVFTIGLGWYFYHGAH